MICLTISLVTALFAVVTRSSRLKSRLRRVEKIADGGFLLALSGLLAKVAMADGEVSSDEVESVEGIFTSMGLSPAGRAMCVGNFYLAQHESCDARENAKALSASLNHIACLLLYGLLWRVANADWRIAEGEERILAEVAEALGLNDEDVRQVREGRLQSLDRKALADAGVPETLIRYMSSVGPKDAGRGIGNR